MICDTFFGSLPGYQKSLRNEQKEKSLTGLERDIAVFDLAVTGEFVAVLAIVVLRFSVKMPYAPYLNPKRIRSLLEGFWKADNFRSASFYSPTCKEMYT